MQNKVEVCHDTVTMLKGVLEGCILEIISRQETYGYEIAETLSGNGFGRIAEGTIYPLRRCWRLSISSSGKDLNNTKRSAFADRFVLSQ